MRRVLITGAACRIGSTLRNGFRGRVSALRLLDTAPLGDAQQGEELYAADVRDLPALTDAMTDVDATIHLAGIPQEDTFERIRDINMTGTYHAVELFYCAVTAPNLGFVVAYGISANERRWWDLAPAERFGYWPVDNAENWASQLSTPGDRAPSGNLQGGDYARPHSPA